MLKQPLSITLTDVGLINHFKATFRRVCGNSLLQKARKKQLIFRSGFLFLNAFANESIHRKTI